MTPLTQTEEVRTLWVDYDSQGERLNWRDAVREWSRSKLR